MRKLDINSPVFFIGIGGSGMAPLAELCARAGIAVSGSDLTPNLNSARLENMGIPVYRQHMAENLPAGAYVVHSSAILTSNPEYMAAQDPSYRLIHRSELLAKFVNNNHGITIAGTHGKTTTSAMTAYVLHELGAQPSAAVGGRMLNFDAPALYGQGDYFVAEADESDGSLVHYEPFVSVVTNIAEDHLENLKNLQSIEALFQTYVGHTHADGCAVIGWDNRYSRSVGEKYTGNKLTFGSFIGSDVRVYSASFDQGGARFQAVVERDQVQCQLKLLGKHNVENALATLAVVRALELDVQQAAACLAEFEGVARRTSLVYKTPSTLIFDDYAHNPEKIAASIASVAEAYPGYELKVVFQPHRFSRLKLMFDDIVSAFSRATQVFVLPTYSAGEPNLDEFSSRRVAEAIGSQSRVDAKPMANFGEASRTVVESLKGPAIILTVGAGDVWQCGHLIRDTLHGEKAQRVTQTKTPKT